MNVNMGKKAAEIFWHRLPSWSIMSIWSWFWGVRRWE